MVLHEEHVEKTKSRKKKSLVSSYWDAWCCVTTRGLPIYSYMVRPLGHKNNWTDSELQVVKKTVMVKMVKYGQVYFEVDMCRASSSA